MNPYSLGIPITTHGHDDVSDLSSTSSSRLGLPPSPDHHDSDLSPRAASTLYLSFDDKVTYFILRCWSINNLNGYGNCQWVLKANNINDYLVTMRQGITHKYICHAHLANIFLCYILYSVNQFEAFMQRQQQHTIPKTLHHDKVLDSDIQVSLTWWNAEILCNWLDSNSIKTTGN